MAPPAQPAPDPAMSPPPAPPPPPLPSASPSSPSHLSVTPTPTPTPAASAPQHTPVAASTPASTPASPVSPASPASPASVASPLATPTPTSAQTPQLQASDKARTAAAAAAASRSSLSVRKLHKHRRDGRPTSPVAMEFPDRLRMPAAESGDDGEVLRPNLPSSGVFMNLHQSIFGLIAAAGSTVNFNDRFENHSSDDDDDEDGDDDATGNTDASGPAAAGDKDAPLSRKRDSRRQPSTMAQSTILEQPSARTSQDGGVASPPKSRDRHGHHLAESKLLRSLPSLKTRLARKVSSAKEAKASKKTTAHTMDGAHSSETDASSSSGAAGTATTATTAATAATAAAAADPAAVPPAIRVTRVATRENRSNSVRSIAPVMSRMLEAEAELAATRPSFDMDRPPSDGARSSGTGARTSSDSDAGAGGPSALARKLMDIFRFDTPEEVIDEYPCWLLQSVLLQGYLYITARHICFYAYLPKKANEVAKSGYLAKCGKHSPKYSRFWFRLKGDVLAYYRDPSNLYFPHGQIDLRYGISAAVTGAKDSSGGSVHFQVVTHNRTYYFRADSAPSAKEWVKSLQRVIFRSRNDGDSVKISLPIENVLDIEETQSVVEFADTCKIRVIDNDETYAIDEYFFSFFDYGKEAVRILRILVDDAAQQQRDKEKKSKQAAAAAATDTTTTSRDSASAASAASGHRPSSAILSYQGRAGAPASPVARPRRFDSVRATLGGPPSPVGGSPRASVELARRSYDGTAPPSSSGRPSVDRDRARPAVAQRPPQQPLADLHESIDSLVAPSSLEDPSQASFSNLVASSSDEPSSASQILHGSDVFQSTTMAGPQQPSSPAQRHARHSSRSRLGGAPHVRHAATTGHMADATASSSEVRTRPSAAAGSTAGAGSTTNTAGTTTPGGLQNLAKIGSYPLQRASAYAGWLNQQSRKMSSLLATESMGYVEKVSGMWKGGHLHYEDTSYAGPRTDDELDDEPDVSGASAVVANERFRAHFTLPASEVLQATYFGYLMRVLPLYGKIYISDRSFCFRSLLPGTRTKLILPLQDVENVTKEKGFRFGFAGLVVVIRGHEELFFEFGQVGLRDDCTVTLLQTLESLHYLKSTSAQDAGGSGGVGDDDDSGAEAALAEHDALQEARQGAVAAGAATAAGGAAAVAATTAESHALAASKAAAAVVSPAAIKAARENEAMLRRAALMRDSPTILFDDPKASFLNFKPAQPLRITCLTIGSRGDVQPYIALGLGLQAEGHRVRIATHPEFEGWIRGHGLDYGRVEGDPGELMRICIENGTFTLQFLREANAKMRSWLDELLASAWTACADAELLIESPSAMAGIHIAERLQIPYFRAFTMPWTRTRAYPHAFIMPEHKMGGAYNYITYVMFDNIFWKATASQINRWRNKTLGLPNTTLEKMQPNKVPFLYNFSASVVPPPLDYSDWIRVTGYWFLDEGTTWTPPAELAAFIAQARRDKKKLVYVGFGSILVPDPAKMTQEVVDAVLKADVRCILSKGWSDRLVSAKDKDKDKDSDKNKKETPPAAVDDVPLPPEIFLIKSAPHDWLFGQIDAAAHHGGSGTTGASLRAGIPTIIRPFFGDQFFFGGRVEDLGVGVCLKRWDAMTFARALWLATNSERMIKKAAALGRQIREENGVDTAIQCIYRDMEYAKSLVKAKAAKSGAGRGSQHRRGGTAHAGGADGGDKSGGGGGGGGGGQGGDGHEDEDDDDDDEPEESWTFVGEDDPMQQSMILKPDSGRAAAAAAAAR